MFAIIKLHMTIICQCVFLRIKKKQLKVIQNIRLKVGFILKASPQNIQDKIPSKVTPSSYVFSRRTSISRNTANLYLFRYIGNKSYNTLQQIRKWQNFGGRQLGSEIHLFLCHWCLQYQLSLHHQILHWQDHLHGQFQSHQWFISYLNHPRTNPLPIYGLTRADSVF